MIHKFNFLFIASVVFFTLIIFVLFIFEFIVPLHFISADETFPLHDQAAIYTLRCDKIYTIQFQRKGKIKALYVGSSSISLEKYCNKNIAIKGNINLWLEHPYCINSNDADWCRQIKTPVINVQGLQLAK